MGSLEISVIDTFLVSSKNCCLSCGCEEGMGDQLSRSYSEPCLRFNGLCPKLKKKLHDTNKIVIAQNNYN